MASATSVQTLRLTGLDLRLKRTAAMVKQVEIARELGVSRQAIGNLEGMLRPGPAAVTRYLEALQRVAL